MSLTGHLSSSVSCTACSRRLGTAANGCWRAPRCDPLRCTASKRHSGAGEEGTSGSRQLPREQGWLLDEANSRHRVKAVGPGFVMTRPGTQGLVISPASKLQPYQERERSGGGGNLSLALARMQRQTDTGLVPFQLGGAPILVDAIETDDFIVVDASVVTQCVALVPSSPQAAAAARAAALGPGCLGIVPAEEASAEAVTSAGEDGMVVERTSPSHPRRTSKVKFRCDRCGTTTIAPVNPTAFATGSVFGACGGCGVVHKLVDNLKLFHEVRGHIFHPHRPAVRIPRSLPQNPGIGLRKIGGYDFLNLGE